MKLAQRITRIKPSATLTINTKAQELRAAGRQIVSLAVGEPDFRTPEHVCDAAKVALDQGFTRYTPVPGIPELRTAVAAYFKTFYGVDAAMENVVVTNGGKQSLYNLFQVLLDPGDEVIIPAPYWVSYPALVQLADGVSVFVTTEPENAFLVSVEQLEAARTPRTRCLVMNTPSNPTGCHYTQAQLDAIAAWAVEKGVFVISDEIYDQLVYAPARPASLAPWWQRHPENFAVVNGLAKSFAMTGWRVGYTLAHADLIKAMTKIQGQSTSNICSIAQKAALAALTGGWDCLAPMLAAFVRRRDLGLSMIRAWGNVVCPEPAGAFYLFPQVDWYYTPQVPDSTALCGLLLEKAGVALVPGAAFGDDRCIRISYALDDETLAGCLDRIGQVLHGLKK
ncbi:MAG: pyridoxal phosphate-dependent aminotransferase [Desulfomicrobium sp.]|nr:pyridoxal phosphate-dependent aminotransferase [Desulfomicrobium sp.]MDP3430789.1 pyridoxal phosphate-dependent aminotransferase [Desulfomicrobium sp.]